MGMGRGRELRGQAMPMPMSRSGACGLAIGRWVMLTVGGGGGSTLASAAQAGFSAVLWSSRIDRACASRAGDTVRPVAHWCQSPSASSRSRSQRARPA